MAATARPPTRSGNGNTSAGNTNDSDSEDNDGVSYPNNYANDGQRNVAGQFDYYALVLSWSPSYCAEKGDRDQQQCNRRDGRRYSFVLHGLWPQYERGYPSACQLSRRPFVPDPVISSMLDIMPSRGLVIHEYRTHGTCSGLDPSRYFATAHRLFDGITIPERFRNPCERSSSRHPTSAASSCAPIPISRPDMIAVVCDGRDKSLREVHICYSKDGTSARLRPKRKPEQALLGRSRFHSAGALDGTRGRAVGKPSRSPRSPQTTYSGLAASRSSHGLRLRPSNPMTAAAWASQATLRSLFRRASAARGTCADPADASFPG